MSLFPKTRLGQQFVNSVTKKAQIATQVLFLTMSALVICLDGCAYDDDAYLERQYEKQLACRFTNETDSSGNDNTQNNDATSVIKDGDVNRNTNDEDDVNSNNDGIVYNGVA